jgi:ribosomal protein L12E/L44/L45/RPP1/RPP2
MIKSLSALFILGIWSFALKSQNPITVRMSVPAEVVAGQEFLVSVEIQKGELEEFSRFQQELPAGLIAVQENSGSADFSFENQRVRFLWLKLPAESNLSISYKVRVNERLKGTLTLFGEFSYVEKNERKSIVIDKKVVEILPSPEVAADQQIDIANFAAVMAREHTAASPALGITCIRQTPYASRTGNDILVNLLVYKKDMNKFAKIEEKIPEGFEAVSMESQDGLFTFKDRVAKFVWMNLPDVPGFKVSYRLIPQAGKTLSDLRISGVLSYIQEGRNITVDVVQKDIDLAEVDESNIEATLAMLDRGETPAVTKPGSGQAETMKTPPPREETPTKVETQVKEKTPATQETVARESKPAVQPGSSRIPSAQLLPVYDGVYFRIQLAATRQFTDAGSSFEAYRLSRPVLVEQHDGLYKYTAGSFPTYPQAREFKNAAISRGISGAFIVAYRNGRRIDVMDAIQATGGK